MYDPEVSVMTLYLKINAWIFKVIRHTQEHV